MDKKLVIEKVLVSVPKFCYSCGKGLVLTEDYMHLYCPNPKCSGKFYRRLEIMAKAFGIENIGVKVAEELVTYLGTEDKPFNNLSQLFDFTKEDFLRVPRFKEGMAEKLYESIKAVKTVEFERFIKGIQLKRVGEGTAGDLAYFFARLDDLLFASKEEINKALKVKSDIVSGYIYDAIQEQKEEILALAEKVEIIYPEKVSQIKNLSNVTAVITGSLNSMSRKDFEKKYSEEYGLKFVSSISSNVNYLIYNGDKNTSKPSSKLKKALSLNIEVLTEQEFIEKL